MVFRGSRLVALSVLLGGAALLSSACGNDAVGVEACRTIEEARCKRAPQCGVDMSVPVHRDSPSHDVDACIRYYNDACLHGLATDKDPGGVATQACVDAIMGPNCSVVLAPETSPACAFLIPPVVEAAAADAGDDAADSGASTDLSDASIETLVDALSQIL